MIGLIRFGNEVVGIKGGRGGMSRSPPEDVNKSFFMPLCFQEIVEQKKTATKQYMYEMNSRSKFEHGFYHKLQQTSVLTVVESEEGAPKCVTSQGQVGHVLCRAGRTDVWV